MTDASPVSMNTTGAIRKTDMSLQNTGRFLAPLEKRSSSGGLLPLAPIESARHKRFEISNLSTNAALVAPQIGVSIKNENRLEPLAKSLENASSSATFKGFTLSGKGSMFLKSNAKKDETPKSTSDTRAEASSSSKNFKSILRDSSLTDVRSRPEQKPIETESEDRKSVRFNLNESAKSAMYKGLVASDDSSNDDDEYDDENADWDFTDGVESHVKEVTMTLNRNANQQSESIESEASTVKNFTTLFDRNAESGRIKPMYEDTDSESVASIKSNRRHLDEEKKLKKIDLPKPISHRLKVFEKGDDQDNAVMNRHKAESSQKSIQLNAEHDFEVNWQEEKAKLQKIFDEKRAALEKEHAFQLIALEKELEEKKNDRQIELESQHNVDVEKFKQQLKDEFEEKRKILNQEHRLAEEKLQETHKIIIQELERDLKSEEELIKKDHSSNLQQLKDKLTHELDVERQKMRETGESHLYEKIRCEKRLLEDKYRCLKDKYSRLKSDVKISLERRHQRREQQSFTTGSETERSNSNKQSNDARSSSISVAPKAMELGRPPGSSHRKETPRDKSVERDRAMERSSKKFGVAAKYLTHIQNQQHPDDTSISQSDTTISNNYNQPSRRSMPYTAFADNGNSDSEAFQQENNNNVRDSHGRPRKKTFTRTKSASTSRLNSSNLRGTDPQLRPCTPVENLRRQLQKLEDLEDQFPDNSLDTTYHLRYPFNIEDRDASSSELEFFKHRIHLERDSVRRAKESLRSQRSNFRARQREVKHHHKTASRHTVDHMIQEEKELTEMEVNLHRTRALLGEKVIRLRHLEQSLQRLYDSKEPHSSVFATDNNRDDATISDLSSHSSSGFSSTDFASDTHGNGQRKEMYQESSEIIQSLEHLNSEIREIWDILSKQHTQGERFQQIRRRRTDILTFIFPLGLTPPPSLLYQDIMWPTVPSVPTIFQADASNQAQNVSFAMNPPVVSLADRLETYRQIASGRISLNAANGASSSALNPSAMLSQSMTANGMVSQSPLAQSYKTNLIERTQDLRNWLKQAKSEHELLSGTKQTDL